MSTTENGGGILAASASAKRVYQMLRASLSEDDTVLSVTLDHPKGNILSVAMIDELEAVLVEHSELASLRLVILRGAGGNFSFGASVPEHTREQAPRMLAAFHRFVRMLAAYPVPVAALVEGRCLGGAFEVVLCCHFIFAAQNAVFACPEIKLGVFPPVLAVLGPLRLPSAAAERLLLTGDEIDAATAGMLGMVTAVLGTDKEPLDAVLEWYRAKLRPLSAFTIRQTTLAGREESPLMKALGTPLSIAEKRYLWTLMPSHDANEGIAAFMERRRPVWKDA
jgi:cyclohexa-1,5-dienecarbonyl-CoA hydratase